MKASDTFAVLRRQPTFSTLVDDVERVLGPALASYLDELGDEFELGGAKAIKDAVWGMIDITPQEVVVLDSPPMQRLRGIKQLGVSYLTYPTAGYSRFEHSVGALRQAERMLAAIATRSDFARDVDNARPVVRVAALLHDVGHMPLSHVAERYFSEQECTHDELIELALDITAEPVEALRSTEPGLAECLSAAVIASPSFDRLLREKAGYDKEQVAAAALAILGKTPTIHDLFVSQLISNVVDADKLDYMFRDAFVTRVPLAVDLERLLFKLTIVEFPADRLWGSLAKSARISDRALVLGTDATGQEITYDLASARKLLFERIYFHHKTRAAERVALRAFDRLAMRPAELLAYDDELLGRYGAEKYSDKVGLFAERLINRRLPKRVFALADDFIDRRLVAREASDRDRGKYESAHLRGTVVNAKLRAALEEKIRVEASELAALLGSQPPSDVWIDIPPDPIGTGDARLPEITPDKEVILPPAYPPGAAAAAQNPLPTTFIFVTEAGANVALAHLASQRVLAREFGLYFTNRAAVYAKVSVEQVEHLKRELEATKPDAFKGLRGLRPHSEAAHSAFLNGRIMAQAARFQHFTTDSEIRVDADRIRDFLDQFPGPLVEPMLKVIESISWLDRATLGRKFADRMLVDAPLGAIFVPLTQEYGKSAAHLPYFLADHPANPKITDLQKALEAERPIVVFDDVLISGVQSTRVVDTWFGADDLRSAPVLDDHEQAKLVEKVAAFRFAYARTTGLEALLAALKARGVEVSVEASDADAVERPLSIAGTHADDLRTFLREVGEDLLKSTKGRRVEDPWSPERCVEHALGYGDNERLVVLEYNTPTGTVTALWSPGVYDGAQWLPLFPRRASST